MAIHWVDWVVLILTLTAIIGYGIFVTRKNSLEVASFLKGTEPIKWWTIGISVMATQASAITFMSTPGQAFHDGMGFVQMYLGLPIAMVIISITFIPIFHKLNVFTAYEYLESRFDNKTRTLASVLFLIQRGLGTGLTIYAPSIILSTILGWDLSLLNTIIGALVVLYIISGGTVAVSITQNQQMAVMMGGMVVAFFIIYNMLPDDIGFTRILQIANAAGKMEILNFSTDIENKYTFWSGITGGTFLALAYFGTDQSQVQRYISGNNVRESRLGLMFNGLLKVPMQFFILFCGIMVFVFYQFHKAPIFFNQATLEKVEAAGYASEVKSYEAKYDVLFNERKTYIESMPNLKDAAALEQMRSFYDQEKTLRKEVKTTIKKANPSFEDNDKDYVFISFILKYLPKGIVGLLLAVIFCASMSATASGISALASCTTLDIYKRNFAQDKSDDHHLKMSKWFILLWGIIAIASANMSSLYENLIQFVNIVGSIFYGPVLGIFIVGFYLKSIKGTSVFIAGIASQLLVIFVFMNYEIGYLWLIVIGCITVVGVGLLMQLLGSNKQTTVTN
jgi:solute:Na+ symporter, SSS family